MLNEYDVRVATIVDDRSRMIALDRGAIHGTISPTGTSFELIRE